MALIHYYASRRLERFHLQQADLESMVGNGRWRPTRAPTLIFRAKSMKPLSKMTFEPSYCPWLIARRTDNPPNVPEPSHDVADKDVPPWNMGRCLQLVPERNGCKFHGRTPSCNACSYERLHGRTQSKKCKQRYLEWLANERAKYQSREDNLVPPAPESSESRDRDRVVVPSEHIPNALPVEYQPPSPVRPNDEDYGPSSPRYIPSEAPSAEGMDIL